uniref:Large ribosomal subunit protein uL22c n=1 Tax=Diselma archeri TaxID=13497 RepID=A0A6J4AH69_9CONI|nr:ribosomal protein L22 [Diselma archeri]BBN66507.1 ribosomal protein L22 [Diselma archeri]
MKMLIPYLLGRLMVDDNGNPGLEILVPKTRRAVAKHVHMSANKARRVAHLLPNSTYMQAFAKLSWMPYRACEPILEVLRSAAANVYHNNDHVKSELFVLSAEVTEGPIFKRLQPRARGRGYPIEKSTCYISITLGFYKSYDHAQDFYKDDNMNNIYYQKLYKWMTKKKNKSKHTPFMPQTEQIILHAKKYLNKYVWETK